MSRILVSVTSLAASAGKMTLSRLIDVACNQRTRRFRTAVGQNTSSQALKLAENENDSRAGGGTCFGDSGGPAFHDGLLVADTSFGASQFCRSFGGYYRLDTADARMFLDDYVPVP